MPLPQGEKPMPLLEIHQFDEYFREKNGFGIDFFPQGEFTNCQKSMPFPREKNQCHFQKFRQFDEFFRKFNQIYTKFHQFDDFFS